MQSRNIEYENKTIYRFNVLLYKGELTSKQKYVVENRNTESGGKA